MCEVGAQSSEPSILQNLNKLIYLKILELNKKIYIIKDKLGI